MAATTHAPPALSTEERLDLRRVRRRALVVAAALMAVAIALGVVVSFAPNEPWLLQPLDDRWNRWMVDHRTSLATDVALVISFLGSAWVTWPVRALAAWVLWRRRRTTQLAAFVVANLVAQVCVGPLKAIIDRPRPLDPLVLTRSAAFPSGHAIGAAVTAFGLVIAFVPRGRTRLVWTGLASAFAASMAFSRTYLAAHWLSDTIAGIGFGVAIALAAEAFFERYPDDATEVDQLPA